MYYCMPQKYCGFKKYAEGGLASNLMWKYDWLLQYQVTFYIRIWWFKKKYWVWSFKISAEGKSCALYGFLVFFWNVFEACSIQLWEDNRNEVARGREGADKGGWSSLCACSAGGKRTEIDLKSVTLDSTKKGSLIKAIDWTKIYEWRKVRHHIIWLV